MENELLEKFSDNEKIVLFNLVLELAKEKKTTFESQIGTVINAFLVKKKNDEFDMTPKEEYKQEPFDFSMEPSKKDDSKSTGDYDEPLLEPIDTQKVDYNNGISF